MEFQGGRKSMSRHRAEDGGERALTPIGLAPPPTERPPSAFRKIDREAAGRRLLVPDAHIAPRLLHRLDAIVERHDVAAVPAERQRRGGNGLDRSEAVALDARNLDQSADR